MRKIALGMAVAASAIAAPALARDGQAYLEADIGAVIDNQFDVAIQGFDDAASVDHSDGWDLGAIFGYDFGLIRTEAEVAYKEGVRVEQVELLRRLQEMATQYKVPLEKLYKDMQKSGRMDDLVNQILSEKVVDLLVQNARIEDAPDAPKA